MISYNNIVVFDFETSSNRPSDTEIVQIAAIAINPRNLSIYPNSDFNSLVQPLKWDKVQEEALKVNKKTREELEKAPLPNEVWNKFHKWCLQWYKNGKTDEWSAPIPAGHNIIGFDLPIYDRYCREYGTTRTQKSGEVVSGIFSNFIKYDTMQLLGYWTENLKEPAKLGMDYLRKYFAMGQESIDKGHDALADVYDTANILIKLLGLSRRYGPKIKFKDSFAVAKEAVE